ncbi:MAG: DNA polymerase III subunit gamma/tau [Phycisphaera sp.]|nr:MAG: DNA polymerase III subunit gamma/tau [Phycisphaera sp.]
MAYTALARRYRSQDFETVVGQEAVARTLAKAIEQGRVGHAYLFCGTRGVGKTSMARIFAKALAGGTEDTDAAIMAGQDSDVIEIDAASNRGVDNARELIANAGYMPLRGKLKVYIIDEVHMLTKEAFNTLLKTMEEPPDHVKFILCTTEANKVPPTIQSRCQRFDFRMISANRIADHLREVSEKEGVQADDDLLAAVARLGAGSMRDALSLLDRLMAAGDKKLTLARLEELLGLPDRELIGKVIDAIASSDTRQALEAGDELLGLGIGPELALETLANRLRDLMILGVCGPETTLVELSDAARQSETQRAGNFDAPALSHMIALCETAQRVCRESPAPRAMFDAALVRLAMAERFADLTALASGGGASRVPEMSRGKA